MSYATDIPADKHHADPQAVVAETPSVARTAHPRKRGGLLLKSGGVILAVSFIGLMLIGLFGPKTDAEQVELALGSVMGDERSQLIILGSQIVMIGFTVGILFLIVGVVVRLAFRGR